MENTPEAFPLNIQQLDELIGDEKIITRTNWNFESERNMLHIRDSEDRKSLIVRIPVQYTIASIENRPRLEPVADEYILFLVRAGNCALGRFADGEWPAHRVIRKYMTRKKQGKSQLSYLKTKGKSRLGSRVRLQQSREFFSEINQWLCEELHSGEVDRIGVFCPPLLWGELFQAEPLPPFDKKDQRLFRIPVNINTPNFTELQRVNRVIRQPLLTILSTCPPDLRGDIFTRLQVQY
jgi:hypothetical protein